MMGPPTGFCTPPDSIPVMIMPGPRMMGTNLNVPIYRKPSIENTRSNVQSSSLFAARNMFNSSLKKLSASTASISSTGEENSNNSNSFIAMERSSSPCILKIPTPSMLNQQLPPPLPTITTSNNSGIDFPSTSTVLSKPTFKSKTSLQQRIQPLAAASTTKAPNLLRATLPQESLNNTDDVYSTNSSLLQEEQAAAAALLGQFSNF